MSAAAAALPSKETLLHTYRTLYRSGLRAVQYSTPARYAIRDKLRTAFRTRPASAYNQTRIDNTLEFLDSAAKYVGLEHRLVRNLCYVEFWARKGVVR